MSTKAGLLVTALPAIAVAHNHSPQTTPRSNFSSPFKANCDYTNTQGTYNTELSCRISRSSSQQNLETDSGKGSCSPALLDCSFDSGIVVGANGTLKEGGVVECSVMEKVIGAKTLTETIERDRMSETLPVTSSVAPGVSAGCVIGTGMSCNAEEQMRQKLRYERLQQWRLILLELDRQRDPYRRLRERLSKICERRIFKKGSANENICNVCCCQIVQFDSKSVVTCCVCNKQICRGAKCSTWLPKAACWECQLCHTSKDSLSHTQSWVAEQMSFNRQKYVYPMRARSEIYIPIRDCNESPMHFESVSQVGENTAAITAEQKLKIREYVEEVVANLLGGSLDQIRVGQLSKSENYLPGILNNSEPPQPAIATTNGNQCNNSKNVKKAAEFSEISQTRLRYLIESIIAETLGMPPLANGSASEVALNVHARSNGAIDKLALHNGNLRLRHRHRSDHYFEPKIYQDLLATAVLNKIADREGNLRQLSESTPDLSSRNIDANFNAENQSTSSGSSVEPRSDFSYTDTEQSPKITKTLVGGRESALSDYIAGHTVPLPDLSAAVTESEEDDHISMSSSTLAEGTWEDNWLFKKKRSSLTTSMTGSVGMLVPAPKDDVRAQIGDKTTDEISDLSEMGSDTDDSSIKTYGGNLDQLNDRILSKHLIGGQNTKVVLDELIESTSLVSNTTNASNAPEFLETRNEHVVVGATLNTEAVNSSVFNHTVKEAEVKPSPISDQLSTDSNHTDESTPTTIESLLAEYNNEQDRIQTNSFANTSIDLTKFTNGSYLSLCPSNSYNTATNTNQVTYFTKNKNAKHEKYINSEDDDDDGDDGDVVLLRHFLPGSIAEREHKKWNNAVDMPNNPYAPEALKRRISGSPERFIDLPNINLSMENQVISLMETTKTETNSVDEIEYARYSRDYYINDDKASKTSPKHQSNTKDCIRSSVSASTDGTTDIAINEGTHQVNDTSQVIENPIEPQTTLYQALPAHVVEESTSIETLSNQSMQSVNTTTSDDSDTVRIYDFKKQQTIIVRNGFKVSPTASTESLPVDPSDPILLTAATISTSVEDSAPNSPKTSRPTDFPLETNSTTCSVATARTSITPTRGSTPIAFKFLQPKRKLIYPSQILSVDEGANALTISPSVEKAVVEEEVAQVMPSVKALAQAFLLSSSTKTTSAEKRWRKGVHSMPPTSENYNKQDAMKKPEARLSLAEVAENATIASDLSSLESASTISKDDSDTKSAAALSPIFPSHTEPTSQSHAANIEGSKSTMNALRRVSMLKSNIAFFENLKFK